MRNSIRHISEKSPNLFGFFSFLTLVFLWAISLQWAGRLLFLLQRGLAFKLDAATLVGAFWYGFPLDLAFTGYILLLFMVLYLGAVSLHAPAFRRIMFILGVLLVLVTCIINLADAEMFRVWGTRFNRQALQYMRSPKEAMASSANAGWWSMILLLLAAAVPLLLALRKLVNGVAARPEPRKVLKVSAGAILLAPLIVLAVRGGTGAVPINQSVAYFSVNPAANLAAVNGPWNFLYYLINKSETLDPEKYHFLPGTGESRLQAFLYNDTAAFKLSDTEKPNICIVMLESFSASTSRRFGGKYDCTPFLDSLAETGLSFTRAYAQGDRTDKGLACMIGGWPGQPWQSILHEPDKAAKLPSLPRVFSKSGYRTSFVYGGDLGFANMKAYLASAGVEQLLDEASFPAAEKTSKWGAHDQFAFGKYLQVNDRLQEPFLSMMLTLSSHEPFDVPGGQRYTGSGEYAAFLNSVMYTDACIRRFIGMAARAPWFKNTIFVFVADHGRDLGLTETAFDRSGHFHIPVIFWGPALSAQLKGKSISRVVSQTDIGQTLVQNILHPNQRIFPYGRNMLSDKHPGLSSYHFNNGVGVVCGDGYEVMHNEGKHHFGSIADKTLADSMLKTGQALQYLLVRKYKDF